MTTHDATRPHHRVRRSGRILCAAIAALPVEDAADQDVFNQILWRAIKGGSIAYPGARRASAHELKTGE